MTSTYPKELRGRRAPRRSRFGCRNCKLRKLKCDECKPCCKRCSSFGVLCNFMPGIPDLQPAAADTAKLLIVRRRTELRPPLSGAVWTSDETSCHQLNAKCQDFITRYLGRGLATPDDPTLMHANRMLLGLAFTNPFLMHAFLAVAFTYDRHVGNSQNYKRSLEECHHWHQSTILLNRRLREPIETKDKDPIWGTAAALSILAFSCPDAGRPEESWPLTPSGRSDLDWVRMGKAKMSLWHTVNPLRPDSIFRIMGEAFAFMFSPLPERGVDGISSALAAVCLLQDSSTADSNPYFHAAHAVSLLLSLPDDEVTTGPTQLFIRTIDGAFEDLLRDRDPVALLLLYMWYRKASRGIWWIELRARVECPSILTYLRLHHAENIAIQAFFLEEDLNGGRSGSDVIQQATKDA